MPYNFGYVYDLYFYSCHRTWSRCEGNFFTHGSWEQQVVVIPTPRDLTISHSLLVESCNFPLSYICTTFYLEADPHGLKMEAVHSWEMPVHFYHCIHYVPEDILRPCEPYTIPKLLPVSNFILICIHSYGIRHAWIFCWYQSSFLPINLWKYWVFVYVIKYLPYFI